MEPVDLFYSYAHEDEALRDELAKALRILERKGVLRAWHDRRIEPAQPWDQQIDTHLNTADLILLLVSSDFMASDYIWGKELAVAMARSDRGEASVVPVLVRECLMEDAPFAKLQGLPTDLKAVTSWPNRDEAWTDVAKGIRMRVLALQAREAASAPPQVVLPLPPAAAAREGWAFRAEAVPEAPPVGRLAPSDPLLDRVVHDFTGEMESASHARGMALDRAAASDAARALIDEPRYSRVLWVDDRPDNNRREMAALRKLQIEVVTVTSTAEALARIAGDAEPFDLVLSDWVRPGEPTPHGVSAGEWLLRELRRLGHGLPVVIYHGAFAGAARTEVQRRAAQEGAFGEAVLPDQLLPLVRAALLSKQ